jgi:hypothetical protein
LILHTDCHEAGTVIVRGAFSVTDNATGGFEHEGGTLTQTERLAMETISDAIATEIGTGTALTAIPWNASWDAQVESEVADALNAAIPASPTGDSINDYIQRLKWSLVNKMDITEANGNTVTYKDDDSTPAATVAAAFTTNSTTTTRKRLE